MSQIIDNKEYLTGGELSDRLDAKITASKEILRKELRQSHRNNSPITYV